MKLTAKTVWNSRAAMEIINQQSMPTRVAYEFSRVYKVIKAELVTISEHAKSLAEKLGGSVDSQGRIVWPKANPDAGIAYDKEFSELLEPELELNIQPMKLYQIENLDFPPAVFVDLDWLFTDEPKPAGK